MVADNIDIYKVSMDGRLINVMVSVQRLSPLLLLGYSTSFFPLSVLYILIFLYTEVLISHLKSTFFNFLSPSHHCHRPAVQAPKKIALSFCLGLSSSLLLYNTL